MYKRERGEEQNRKEGEMAQNSREKGEIGAKMKGGGRNEMLGVGRYRLEGNFMAFLTCVMTRDRGTGNLTYSVIPLGLLGLPLSDFTEKAWNKTLTRLRLPGLKIGDEQHTTPTLGRKGS